MQFAQKSCSVIICFCYELALVSSSIQDTLICICSWSHKTAIFHFLLVIMFLFLADTGQSRFLLSRAALFVFAITE